MKVKRLFIVIICIGLIIIIPKWITSLYSSQPSIQPDVYSSIEEFEKETGINIYNFYDLEEFITYGRLIPLKTLPNEVIVYHQSNNKDEDSYFIENYKNGCYTYQMYNNSFNQNKENLKSRILDNGILYQYHFDYESSGVVRYIGFYVKDDYYYQVGFTSKDLSVSEAEQKMIDYIKIVENIS